MAKPDALTKEFSSDGAGSVFSMPPPLEFGQGSGSRIFNVYNSTVHTNYLVESQDKLQSYFGRTSSWSKPQITLHVGRDKHGPTIAVANFHSFSSDFHIGFGDPKNERDMVWDEVKKQSFDHSNYLWQTNVYPDGQAANRHGVRKSLYWKRTHSVGVGDSTPNIFGDSNFKLVDANTNEVIAVFANNGIKSFSKKGKFQINVSFGSDFDIMVIVSGLSLIEKARRRASSRASSGGGGGG